MTEMVHSKAFVYDTTVLIQDTNINKSVYFSRFFDWQGTAREEFFLKNIPGALDFLKVGFQIVTIEASMIYYKELSMFDSIIIRVNTTNLTKWSIGLLFSFVTKPSNLIGIGKQKICFFNDKKQLIMVPELILEKAKNFLWEHDVETREFLDNGSRKQLERKGFFF